jgi:hypothetical protein
MPLKTDTEKTKCFFDCKMRKLFVYLPVKDTRVAEEEVVETTEEETTAKVEEVSSKVETKEVEGDENQDSSNLLFDIV